MVEVANAPAIRVTGLVKNYGEVHALAGLDLEVRRGEVFGLLGPNGAGKTTTVKVLLGLLRADGGRAEVLGLDVASAATEVRRGVGYVPQEITSDPYLSGRENLRFFARLYHLPDPRARSEEVLRQVGLEDAADRLAKTYSGGMRKRLDLGVGLLHDPELHILDEPSLGLDVEARVRVWTHVEELRKRGRTVLLCTNYMDEADRLCDRVAILDRGRGVACDTPSALKDGLGGDVVTLVASERDGAPPPDWAKLLGGLPLVRSVLADGLRATVAVEAGDRALPKVLEATVAASVPIASVSLLRPSLDAVFLRHTGRRLAEGAAAPAPAAGGRRG
ncbi:MAG: ATP-binding cassette domain-containing protein [Planctomycetales bacterium]|nr:ATP-binding cassette domain-containing protein [Planctomycetales bacterium]